MHYYTFHPAKHKLETFMLKPLERLAYRELLDIYYDSEKPLPTDIEELAWRMGYDSDELKQALQLVLDKFFVIKKLKGDDEPMYHHVRLDREIANYKYIGTNTKNANESANDTSNFTNTNDASTSDWQKRKSMVEALRNKGIHANSRMKMADLQMLFDTHCKNTNDDANDANAICSPKNKEQLTKNNKQRTINKESKSEDTLALKNSQNQPRQAKAKAKTEFDAKTYPIGDSIDPDLWNDFVDMRLSIKKPLTEMACKRFVSDFEAWAEEGLSPNLAIAESIKNSWQGIFREKAVMPKIKNSRSFHDELAELEQNNHWGDDFYSRNRTANQAPIFEQPQIGVHS